MTDRAEGDRLLAALPELGARTPASLRLRWASALILVPLGLWVVWQGGFLFAVVVALAAGLMAFEWSRLVHGEGVLTVFYWHIGISTGAILAAAWGSPAAGLLLLLLALPFAAYAARRTRREPMWSVIGILYTTVPCVSLVWIRGLEPMGLSIIVSLLFVIWATDTGAYLTGRTIGGRKLVPKISPSKTWAGLIGGIFWAMLFATFGAAFAGFAPVHHYALLGGVLSLVAQAGDLAESAVKRHFHAKDTSGFIPGHGGLLDRFDGLMFAVIVVACLLLGARAWGTP